MRRTFQDLARQAQVKDIVTRAISGHATDQMQRHYSTVNQREMEESIGKVISLAGARQLLEASRARKEASGPEVVPDHEITKEYRLARTGPN
jgi:hypothetical protein